MSRARVVSFLLSALLVTVHLAAAAPTCNASRQCRVRILALGDSLTRGAVPTAKTTHPYAIQLQRTLRSQLGPASSVSVDVRAYDYMGVFQKARDESQRVLDITLVPYARSILNQASQQPYKWVVVMAGINDLGAGDRTAAEIMPRLIQIYNMALQKGSNVLAILPFPNLFEARTSSNEAERVKLQQLMKNYVAQYQQQQQQKLRSGSNQAAASRQNLSKQPAPVLQLLQPPQQQFDFWNMPEAQRRLYQDDLLHLTPRGYDILGDLIASAILKSTPGGPQGLCSC